MKKSKNSNLYPSPNEILSNPPEFNTATLELTNLWKTTAFPKWNQQQNWIKFNNLTLLISSLSEANQKTKPIIVEDTRYFYNPKHRVIHIDYHNLSIISALHELAHHLFGSSELKACKWSYWLFATCFPKLLNKLTWKGHMLIKN